MSNSNNKVRGFMMTIAAAAFSLSLLTAYPAKAVEPGQLTKTELKSLIKTASTPADHLRVASYYRTEATRLRAQAAEHQAMIAENPMPSPAKVWATRGTNHCQYWVAEYTKEAQQADTSAAQHEQMAAKSASKANL
jgi:hypothetical protein